MRAFVIVKLNSLSHLSYRMEHEVIEQFISMVLFCNGIILRVTTFCHAYLDSASRSTEEYAALTYCNPRSEWWIRLISSSSTMASKACIKHSTLHQASIFSDGNVKGLFGFIYHHIFSMIHLLGHP